MERIVRDLSLGWIRGTNGNGGYIWKCYDPNTKKLIGVYDDEQVISSKEDFERLKKSASGMAGVYLHKSSYRKGSSKIWECRLMHEKKKYYVGMYSTPEEAGIAYNQKVAELGIDKPLNNF